MGRSFKNDEERLAYIKELLDEFVANGGDINKMDTRGDVYVNINGLNIKHPTENRLMTVDEKFINSGYIRKPKTNVYADDVEEYLVVKKEKLVKIIKPFVDAGGDVNKIRVKDKIYYQVYNVKMQHTDGRFYTIAEKFALAGYPLTREQGQRSADVEEELKKVINDYLEKGGSLNTAPSNFPFIRPLRYCLIRKREKTNNQNLTMLEYLEGLGFDVQPKATKHYRYKDAFIELENHKDESGFVDKYVKAKHLYALIGACAREFEMPRDVAIGLMANQNKKEYTLQTDYFKEVEHMLANYKAKYGSYEAISINDKALANKLLYINQLSGNNDSGLEGVIQFLTNDESVKIKRANFRANSNTVEVMSELIEKAKSNGGKLFPKDLTPSDRFWIAREAYVNGLSFTEWFAVYDIDYQSGRVRERGSSIKVSEYPYMKEMRKERDLIFNKFKLENPNINKEDAFENYLQICKKVYAKYEPLILRSAESLSENQSES